MLIHWHIDPVIVSFGPVALRWYGLLFAAPFLAGLPFFRRVFREEGIAESNLDRLLLYAVLGTVVGARLAHCLFYDPKYYFANPLKIVAIWEGGLASHGGIAGLVCGFWLAGRKFSPPVPLLWLLDRLALPGALGAVCIRLGNFMNSEIVGNPTSGSWGVVFDLIDQVPRHPAQLYEVAGYLGALCVLVLLYARFGRRTPQGLLTGWLLTLVFSVRILAEFAKEPQAAYEAGQAFSVGQWLSVPFLALGVGLILHARKHPEACADRLPERTDRTGNGPRRNV
jgi:prolipoprotein diacylglyceryl transferase